MKERFTNSVSSLLGTALFVATFLFFWEFSVQSGRVDPFFFSSPSIIVSDLIRMQENGDITKHLFVTLKEAMWGLFYGGVLGTVSGFIFGASKRISKMFLPIMVGLNGLPKLALGPLLIFWFGIGIESKIVMSAVMVFFPFLFNIYAGYRDVDISLINTVRMMGGTTFQIITKVIWPACMPWLMVSIRTGLGMSILGAIVGEYIGSNRGLGWMIQDAGGTYNITRVLSCIFILIVVMASFDSVYKVVEHRVMRWKPAEKQ
ncbi:ABC transporter permease [Candidatus Contubernalis alkaliaceticus]|uniref:ABC transporter permease n=1 Tax=Candidatus Contubernalis alkaliaceticus TaxID=338645 RepID=UPI001F4BD61A|nr:ABC transporter permease [Candidatus Contubernalis alkalaceticus]UNC90845.1 ABC transporter permease [Candidatus Contubernalis alkalaceticus]